MEGKVFFISGIDTNIGKTFATGIIAGMLAEGGKSVITQKMIQTGCVEISEDIEMHRRLQGIPFTKDDKDGTTCPYVFSYPCSPHMAAEIDGRTISLSVITEATDQLRAKYDLVLLEGAGGLMVPVDMHLTTMDYIQQCEYPLVLVTSGRLGSINHTLLALAACRQYGIHVKALVFNESPAEDALITANTINYLTHYLKAYHPETAWISLPEIDVTSGKDRENPFVSCKEDTIRQLESVRKACLSVFS